jgi:hypothetical protein
MSNVIVFLVAHHCANVQVTEKLATVATQIANVSQGSAG